VLSILRFAGAAAVPIWDIINRLVALGEEAELVSHSETELRYTFSGGEYIIRGAGFVVADTSAGERVMAGTIQSIDALDTDAAASLGDFFATEMNLEVDQLNRAMLLEAFGNERAIEDLFLNLDWTYHGTN